MQEPSLIFDPNIESGKVRTHEDGVRVVTEDQTATLVLNDKDQYVSVPMWRAQEMERKHQGVILTPHDGQMYVDGWKKALGKTVDLRTEKDSMGHSYQVSDAIQVRGKTVPPSDLGRFDADTFMTGIETNYKKNKDAPLPAKERASLDPNTFQGKARQRRFD